MAHAKVAIVTLGCPKNQVDSETMAGSLAKAGYELTANPQQADILLVNTCGFIDSAKGESINTIIELGELKKSGGCQALIATGCLAQRYKSELLHELPELDAVVGTGEFYRIPEIIEQVLEGRKIQAVHLPAGSEAPGLVPAARLLEPGSRTAYVKIAEGCDNRCAYCVIPSIRGAYRSRTMESIIAEVEELTRQGVQEFILIAQDTTGYGMDLYGEPRLAELISRLARLGGVRWLRLLYCYPTHLTGELIKVIAQEPKVCKYLDIPLQHADNNLLKSMGRKGTREEYVELIDELRRRIPAITLRTTFIVGLPGETEEAFEGLLRFMEEIKFDRVGIFTYSAEEGTRAARMRPQVPQKIKQARYNRAMQLQKAISLAKNQDRVGNVEQVLVEGVSSESDLVLVGRSQREAPEIDGAIYIGNRWVDPGSFVHVRIIKAYEYDLVGEVIDTDLPG
ncbi:MAG: 30S ribosomal protein S12 methylthiotransferase RimO [Syntrophothermus sp.]